MIKLIALILTILIMPIAKSQYTPLVVDSSHWIIEACDPAALPQKGSAWEYYIIGDTIANSVQYKKVYRRDWQYDECWRLIQPSSSYQLFSLIREDTLNRKVYSTEGAYGYCAPTHGNDTLLYDFDLQVGDYFNTCLTLEPIFIGEITQGNYFFPSTTYYGQPFSLFEGVGSSFGLFEIIEINVSGGEIPNLTHYCRGGLSKCRLVTSIDNNSQSQFKFNLFPNPSSSQLIVEHGFDNSENLTLDVYLINGKKQFSKIISANRTKLDISFLQQGIYFIQLKNNKKIITTRKWIKNN